MLILPGLLGAAALSAGPSVLAAPLRGIEPAGGDLAASVGELWQPAAPSDLPQP